MSHWSEIVRKAAHRARAADKPIQIPATDAYDRTLVTLEARAYPDLDFSYEPRLGVMFVQRKADAIPRASD